MMNAKLWMLVERLFKWDPDLRLFRLRSTDGAISYEMMTDLVKQVVKARVEHRAAK